jgi:hypothetical protein
MQEKNDDTSNDQLSNEIDSTEDIQKMQNEQTEIEMPGVEDIPGQENIALPSLGELGDLTIASADEEGDPIFEDDIDKEIMEDPESNVSSTERELLRTAANDMPGDDEDLRKAALDDTDEDGAPLNEDSFNENISPDDLDVPGAAADDANEKIGSEDEENNEYSIGGPDNDTEDPPQDQF